MVQLYNMKRNTQGLLIPGLRVGTVTRLCPTLLWLYGLYNPWNSLGHNTGVGNLSLLQGIFATQGSNPDIPHYRWILHQLSHQGSPRILEWVAMPFSRGSSWLRNRMNFGGIVQMQMLLESSLKNPSCLLVGSSCWHTALTFTVTSSCLK